MLGRENIITAEEALDLVIRGLPERSIPSAAIPVYEALGRICADDVVAGEDLPPFPRSTVDGYAVHAADTFSASDTMPAYLNLAGEIFMGRPAGPDLPRSGAVKIPTGGMLPAGADAVVMFEHVQPLDDALIEVMKAAGPGENVIRRAEDVSRNEIILKQGHRMRPQDIGACAGLGITHIPAYRKPAVAIISTGDEIVPPETLPGPGQIRDINSYLLHGLVADEGCVPVRRGIFRDDYREIRKVIEESMHESDVILLSGGTSVGTKDMIAGIILDIGKPGLLFHGVSLKPGKPLIGGIVEGIPLFGLPGHPAAVEVCFDLFIRPVLGRLAGRKDRLERMREPVVAARLSKNIASTPGREEHIRVIVEERDDGLWAIPVISKSGLIATLVRTDGTVVVPLHTSGIQQGDKVEVRLFR